MNTYELGQQIRVVANFTVDGVATDPSFQEVSVLDPSGTTNAITPTPSATGKWIALITPNASGVWAYRWEVTSPFVAAEEDSFFVEHSSF